MSPRPCRRPRILASSTTVCPLRAMKQQIAGAPPRHPRLCPTVQVRLLGLQECPPLAFESVTDVSTNASGLMSAQHADIVWRRSLGPKTVIHHVGTFRCGLFASQNLMHGEAIASYGPQLTVLETGERVTDITCDPRARAMRFSLRGNAGLRVVVQGGVPFLEAFVMARCGIEAGAEVLLGLDHLHPKFAGNWEPATWASTVETPTPPLARDSLSSNASSTTAFSSSSSSSSSSLPASADPMGAPLTAMALDAHDHLQPPQPASLPRVTIAPLGPHDAICTTHRVFQKELHPLAGLPAIAAALGCRLVSISVTMAAPPPPPIVTPSPMATDSPKDPPIGVKKKRSPARPQRGAKPHRGATAKKRGVHCSPVPDPQEQRESGQVSKPRSIRKAMTPVLKDESKRRRLLPAQL